MINPILSAILWDGTAFSHLTSHFFRQCYKTLLKAHPEVWDNFWQLKYLQKWWKIFIISPQKLFSFSTYLGFLCWLFDHVAKQLDKKDKINLKFYDVKAWLTIVIHILSNNSRSKSNQKTKFGQFIKCNIRNIFIQKWYTKCDGETSSRAFFEKLKLSIFLTQ